MGSLVINWPELLDRIVSVLFPHRCLFCDEVVEFWDFWCGKCEKYGKPPFARVGRVSCEFPHGFYDALSAIEYEGAARELIWRIKETPNRRILGFLCGEMYDAVTGHWQDVRFDLIVPVPATESVMKARGFNQAEELARRIGACMTVPVHQDALKRLEKTRVQHGLTALERRKNAEASYVIGQAGALGGKTVLLIDDVFTTGATAGACSGRLLEAGAARVYVLTASASLRHSRSTPTADERNQM